jgi:hypothetical protein
MSASINRSPYNNSNPNNLHFGGVPQASKHPNTARVSANNLSRMAKQLGRCGDINELTGFVCVTQPHDDDIEHMAIQIGGPNDGKVYSTWGGTKVRT